MCAKPESLWQPINIGSTWCVVFEVLTVTVATAAGSAYAASTACKVEVDSICRKTTEVTNW